jgi:hypothetical protein
VTVSLRSFQRRRRAYGTRGLVGLTDGRHHPRTSLTGRADPRVVEAVKTALADNVDRLRGTAERLRTPSPTWSRSVCSTHTRKRNDGVEVIAPTPTRA